MGRYVITAAQANSSRLKPLAVTRSPTPLIVERARHVSSLPTQSPIRKPAKDSIDYI